MGLLDAISPTPRNKVLGLLSDMFGSVDAYANKPQTGMPMGKANPVLGLLSDAFGIGGTARTLDRLSYGEPITNIGKANVPLIPQDTADAAMLGAAALPMLSRGATKAAAFVSDPAVVRAIADAASPRYASPAAIGSVGSNGQGGMATILRGKYGWELLDDSSKVVGTAPGYLSKKEATKSLLGGKSFEPEPPPAHELMPDFSHIDHADMFQKWLDELGVEYTKPRSASNSIYFDVDGVGKVRFSDHVNQSRAHDTTGFNIAEEPGTQRFNLDALERAVLNSLKR